MTIIIQVWIFTYPQWNSVSTYLQTFCDHLLEINDTVKLNQNNFENVHAIEYSGTFKKSDDFRYRYEYVT